MIPVTKYKLNYTVDNVSVEIEFRSEDERETYITENKITDPIKSTQIEEVVEDKNNEQ